jgi:hypothetical protein
MKPNSDHTQSLEIAGDSKPKVPVFTCIVYVRKHDDATVSGRVANLAGIEASGASERDVLGKLAREFKSRVRKMLEARQEIPWINPPQPPLENEQLRSIPTHL